ncbi:hypothetical protein GIS00_14445 [Nakamurella sp. YIM 132087]|uniref:Abortive phage infection protein C-terminal domain-containing protein n=1 Tax=Nakamurella alba TaxID=2665158 RepID=A0A7K1FM52_9ACTN|nr:AIPR family protein [Nakamurella alba]MTD15140.1 hypothetical protein [Nakamurella alba]
MHILTRKRVQKFSRDFGFEGTESDQFERYVAANYLYQYVGDSVDKIERTILGGGEDEVVDIAAVIVNGQIVFEPEEVDDLISDQASNSARAIFIQAKTSESYDSKLIAKFLHGVESITKYAMRPGSIELPPRLVDVATLIDRIAESGDKFQEARIPCDLYYVTTSSNDGQAAQSELQVKQALSRIRDIAAYSEQLSLRTHGHDELSIKQKERYGPQNVQFSFEKRQTIPAVGSVAEAYIGLVAAKELLKLLVDEAGEIRAGIFEDNVRLDLGPHNAVNQRVASTLHSDDRGLFPFLNNGLTLIATELRGSGDRFFISGYQVVNGGQTSHQLVRWSKSDQVQVDPTLLSELWIPIKLVSSGDSDIKTRIAIATNLQTAIDPTDIQSSSQTAKNVEEFFERSGIEGLRYERQGRGTGIEFTRTRVVTTSELDRAVAATLFGESARAIGSPKELESEGAFIWGEFSEEAYYYAAWILYRIDRYFARTPESATLKAAKYHIAMMVSAIVNPRLGSAFKVADTKATTEILMRKRGLEFQIAVGANSETVEAAILRAVKIALAFYSAALAERRSLRKDDVRSRRNQEELLKLATST